MQGGRGREIVEAIRGQLDRAHDRTRWCAVKALGRLDAREALPDLIVRLRHEPDPDVRMEIAQVLGTWGETEAVEVLLDALNGDPDDDVRLQVCRALGQIREPRAEQALVGCLAVHDTLGVNDWDTGDDVDYSVVWELQREALEGLARIGGTRAIEATIHLLSTEDDDDLQNLGLRVLATIGGQAAMGFVLEQLRDGHRTARRQAAKVLSTLGWDDAVIPSLLAALQDTDADVRIAAGWCLVNNAEQEARPGLIKLLQDPDVAVRGEAVKMVSKLIAPEMVTPLIRLAYDPDRTVQLRAIQALGDRRESRAADNLLALLSRYQDDGILASTLIKALGHIKTIEALEPLGQLLQDGCLPPTVRMQAVLAFGEMVAEAMDNAQAQHGAKQVAVVAPYLADTDPIDILSGLVDDEELEVGQAALIALCQIGGEPAHTALLNALQGEVTAPIDETADAETAASFPTSTLGAMQAASVAETGEALMRRQRIRSYAARLLNHYDLPQAQVPLLQAARSDDGELRCMALSALSYRGGDEVASVVVQGMSDASREVRITALQALAQLQPDDVTDRLLERLDLESDPLVKPYLLEAAGCLGDQRVTTPLIANLDDDDRHVQRAALEALAHLADRTAISAVRSSLFAHGGTLWREALTTLQRLHDPDLLTYVLDVLSNPEREEDHWIAIDVLAEMLLTTCPTQ